MNVDNNVEPYLSEIAERLWSGHASLMVGAGFSKNAQKSGETTKAFPSWKELGDCFYHKLYGKKPTEKDEKDKCYLDVLKLANEIEATFGRPTLNKILSDETPNAEYQPSELHIKLLQLPWTDIFTTNYDTLLERAAEKILEWRYETIVNKEDLVWSTKPRIIKLHGSFPSERPFIITEEDFRRYPIEYAPFVNTVQQSLLENTLCLIGFSGDDPNFLKWIGWIRDNLGKNNSSKIYLIGKLSISIGEKKLLEDRNIVPIDLSCYSSDYYKMLLQFVNKLKNKGYTTKNNFDYPKSEPFRHINPNEDINSQFEEIIKAWKTNRLMYPNWLILPKENRERMWIGTNDGIPFIYHINKIDTVLDIEFLYEFNWRIEKCLYPISNEWIEFYENTINKYNLFSENIEDSKWQSISTYWFELQISLLRCYREKNINEKWLALAEKFDKIKNKFSSELSARYNYERCLYYLFLLDIASVRKELANWTTNTTLPYWEAKKAGLIAELGDVEEADKILEISLNEVRNRLKLLPVTNDYALVSQEAYILQLSRYVRESINYKNQIYDTSEEDKTKKYSERWNELIKYKCDPWGELRLFESFLKAEPQYPKTIEKKYGFAIGSITNTYNLNGGYRGNPYIRESYAFLGYIEEIGIPFKLPRVTFGIDTAKKAIACISNYSSNWSFISFIRTGDTKIIDDIFGRRALAFMKQERCDELLNNYLDVLVKSSSEIYKGNAFSNATFAISLSMVIPEILARLCVKCSYEVKFKLLQFVKNLYLADYAKRLNYKGVDKLVQYLIPSFSLREQYELISELLEFPIICDSDIRNPYPDVFAFVRLNNIKVLNKISIDAKKIDELISFLLGDNQKRQIAINRLIVLWKCSLLNETQSDKFTEALWNQVDESGFPKSANFYYFAYLKFPHPKEINPKSLLYNYFKKTSLPIEGNREKGSSIDVTRGNFPLFHNILGTTNENLDYQWNIEDINELISKIIEWWNADKKYLKQTEQGFVNSIADEFQARFSKMVQIFSSKIISKNIELLDSILNSQIDNLLNELSEYGMPDLEAKVSFLKIFPNNRKNIYAEISKKFYSKDESKIFDAVNAVIVLTINENQDIADLLKSISEIIKNRTEIKLDDFLDSIKVILKYNQNLITEDILNDLEIGLSYLKKEILIENDDSTETVHKKLLLTQSASNMLVALKKYYLEQGEDIPQYIIDWETLCLDINEFSDIRNIWINAQE